MRYTSLDLQMEQKSLKNIEKNGRMIKVKKQFLGENNGNFKKCISNSFILLLQIIGLRLKVLNQFCHVK